MAELDLIIVRLDRMDKSIDDRFQALSTRFIDVNHRLDDLHGRLGTVESRLTSIDTRLDGKASQGLVQFWGGFVTVWTSILDQRAHLCKNLRFESMRQLKLRKINGLDSL
jgi:hypothetical protein